VAEFEFVLVLVSMIVGLAIAEIFRGVTRVLRGDLKPYFVHSLWVVQVFLHQVQTWWSYWFLHADEAFAFPRMLHLLVAPSLLFIAATVLFPARSSDVNLRDYYYSRRKAFFGVLALVAVESVLTNLFEQGFNPTTFILRTSYLGALAVLALTSQPRVHAVLTVACVVGLGSYIAVFTPDLLAVATEPR